MIEIQSWKRTKEDKKRSSKLLPEKTLAQPGCPYWDVHKYIFIDEVISLPITHLIDVFV